MGKNFTQNVNKTFHVGVINFHHISPISLIKSYGFYFPVGEIFAKKNYPHTEISMLTLHLMPRKSILRLKYIMLTSIMEDIALVLSVMTYNSSLHRSRAATWIGISLCSQPMDTTEGLAYDRPDFLSTDNKFLSTDGKL